MSAVLQNNLMYPMKAPQDNYGCAFNEMFSSERKTTVPVKIHKSVEKLMLGVFSRY